MSTLSFNFVAFCSNDDLLVNGTGANNTKALKESGAALISSPKLLDIKERFTVIIWVRHAVQLYRPLYVACVAQISSDQPRRWLQYYAPAGHSTSLYFRFYSVLRPPSACLTFINLSGKMRRMTLDKLHALLPDAVYTPPGASRPSKPQRYAQDTSRAAEVINPGPPLVPRAPVLAPVRPSSTPAALDAPGARRPTSLQSARFAARASTPYLRAAGGSLVAHPTMARTGTLPGTAPATPPPPSATPRAPGAPPSLPPPPQ
jgi:hypothetical protein